MSAFATKKQFIFVFQLSVFTKKSYLCRSKNNYMEIHYSNQNNSESGNYGCLTQTIVMTLTLLVVGLILPGVHIDSVLTAVIAAFVIALLNNFLRPILLVLSLPFTIVTMGLFILVINAVIIWLASKVVPSFQIDGFGTAFVAALLITALNYLLELPNRLQHRKPYHENHNTRDDDDDDRDFDEFIEYEEVLDKDDK